MAVDSGFGGSGGAGGSGGSLWTARGTALPMEAESDVRMHDWQQTALVDKDRFEAELKAVGVGRDEVAEGRGLADLVESEPADAVKSFWDSRPQRFISAPPELLTEAGNVYDRARSSALSRLGDWLAGRRLVVDSSTPVDVRVPLFVLAAYAAPGCVSTYKTTTDQSRKLGWSVTVFGSGLSGDATVTSSVTSTLTARAGQAVLVFLPVTVNVERVRLVDRSGVTLNTTQRVNVAPMAQEKPVPGGLLLDEDARPKPGAQVQSYSLSGYGAGVPADYEYTYEHAKSLQLQLGVKAGNIEAQLTGTVSMTTSVTLDFTLIGGRDYKLCQAADTNGLVWA